ncbi:MAG: L,D-transpeptidase [Acidobacteria bacterium]|nr:L,D-transpeptidase [Acidobacteriota bacterium]
MKMILRTLCASVLSIVVLNGAACVNAPDNTARSNTSNTVNANAANTNAVATPSPTPAASSASAAAALPVTLPVLDAMFAEESFAGELKSKIQLTDEQVERLRKIARDETASLSENKGDDHGGTTTQATSRASEKVKEVLGDEKAQAFTAFVRERWQGGEPGAAATASSSSSRPNSVPTDTRIVVNTPAYRMDVFDGGKLVKSYKVGIGYPEFPLPQGQRKAQTIIFNPTWTPPDEPWVEGSGKVKVGQKVEAGSKLNPLGPIKIPIGSPSLIHGGKSPAKLGTFASHGCVGLTSPQVQDFALVFAKIGGAQLTLEDVKAYAAKPTETKNLKLDNAVPVELRYETIVVEDGKLHVYRDVYDKGTNTEENLRAVLEAYGVTPDQLTPQERTQVTAALKEMARDAHGNPTNDAAPAAASNSNTASSRSPAAESAARRAAASSGKATSRARTSRMSRRRR